MLHSTFVELLTSVSLIFGQTRLHLELSLLRAVKYFISMHPRKELARFLEAVLTIDACLVRSLSRCYHASYADLHGSRLRGGVVPVGEIRIF